jgi:hypothetical protein
MSKFQQSVTNFGVLILRYGAARRFLIRKNTIMGSKTSFMIQEKHDTAQQADVNCGTLGQE